MSRTHIGSSMCGIVLENGSDCPNAVDRYLPLNLCPEHLHEAANWFRRIDTRIRPMEKCSLCGFYAEFELLQGTECAECGLRSDDANGILQLTAGERELISGPQWFPEDDLDPAVDVVYYIQFGDRVKIGTSRRVRTRLQALPFDEVLGLERGGRDLERQRHAEFSEHRIKGEWFHPVPRLIEHAMSLREPSKTWDRHCGRGKAEKIVFLHS